MKARIILVQPHQEQHMPAPPVVELDRDGDDPEVTIWFQDDGDGGIAVVGCPQCLAHQLRQLAVLLDERSLGASMRP